MPSFKKLKSKLSIRKSHSTASNLSEILGKNKLSNSTSINNFKLVNNTTPVNKSPNDTSSPSQIEPRLKSSISATPIKQKPQTAHNIDSIEEEPQLQTANVPCIMRQQLKEKSLVNSRTNSPLESTITKEHKHHNNPITELLSSLSFSLSSSNNHRNQNLGNNHHAIKMRTSGKSSNGNGQVNNQKKADIAHKRISLPANYVSQISSSSATLSHSHVNSKLKLFWHKVENT